VKIDTEKLFSTPLTEKTMAKFEQQMKEEKEVPRVKADLLSQYLPGFSIIKNIVIKPLLMATERIVEQIMPEKRVLDMQKIEVEETQSRGDANTKMDTVSLVSGEDGDQRQFRKQMNKLALEEQEFFEQVRP
jgi:hypothetical protein